MKFSIPYSALLISASFLTGCSTMPANGPTATSITEMSTTLSKHNFEIVSLNDAQFEVTKPDDSIEWNFSGDKSEFELKIMPSDVLLVRIWEANPDGLFSSPDNPAPPMEVTVSPSGTIFIPYAGNVNVEGLTPNDVRENILVNLQGKVIDPQIQVELKSSKLSTVSISGSVNRPGQYPLVAGNTEILKILSQAGGTSNEAFESEVTIIRKNQKQTAYLSQVIDIPESNISVKSGDVINVDYRPPTFTAFGAVQKGGLVKFETPNLTLEKAIAKVGGLSDRTAQASGVFLYRNVTRDGIVSPTIFRLDMTEPDSFFMARSFQMERDDILYVANASAADLNKFVTTILGPIVGTAENIKTINN